MKNHIEYVKMNIWVLLEKHQQISDILHWS